MKAKTALLVSAIVFVTSAEAAEPASNKARVHAQSPCCNITAIDQAKGVVTIKDIKSGKVTQITVKDPAKLRALRVGQQVGHKL